MHTTTAATRWLAAGLGLSVAWGAAGARAEALSLAAGGVTAAVDTATGTVTVRFAGAVGFLTCRSDAYKGQRARAAADVPGFPGARALELDRADGDRDVLILAGGSPLLAVRRVLRNGGAGERLVERVELERFVWDPERPPAELQVLGCDGLSGCDTQRASYAFLAAAEPDGRQGLVAGWLTHARASGIVCSAPEGPGLAIRGLSEYGKLRIPAGATGDGEPFAIGLCASAHDGLEALGEQIGRANGVKLPPIPNGYCTWYSSPNGGAASAPAMAELAAYAQRELAPFGFDTIQIDDIWQGPPRPAPNGGPAADFTRHDRNGPYPAGMKPTADAIRAAGLRPGIWLMPFAWDPAAEALKAHPDWFVHKADGGIYYVFWAGWCLDMSHPAARDFLRGAIRRIVDDWGYRYLKLDGLWSGMAVGIRYPEPVYGPDDIGGAVLHDPRSTQVEAYRAGLQAVREGAGADTYLLGCCIAQNMRTLGASYGRVDGMRVGRDTGAEWSHIIPGAEMGSRLYWLHNRVWHNDPDCLMMRAPLTPDMARAWASWIVLSGQLNMISEWIPALTPDRLDAYRRSLPNPGLCGRPLDLFARNPPSVWALSQERDGVRRDLFGFFRWEREGAASYTASLAQAGLPAGPDDVYVGFDYWDNRFVPPFRSRLTLEVGPASARVVAVRRQTAHPLVVSTSRHIAQGMVDLERETWDAGTRTLTGTSRLVGGDPYELRVVVPSGAASWQMTAVRVTDADREAGVTAAFRQDGPRIRATLSSTASRSVAWTLAFKPAAVEDAAPRAPEGVTAAGSTWRGVQLAWSNQEAVVEWQVARRDGPTRRTTAPSLADPDVQPGGTCTYTITGRGWDGRASPPATLAVTVPPRPDPGPVPPAPTVHLSDLKPYEATTGWGEIRANQSCGGRKLTIAGRTYERGMGVHAVSVLAYNLQPAHRRFVAIVGLDDEDKPQGAGSVVFEVYGDDDGPAAPALLARSPILSVGEIESWHFNVPLPEGTKQVRLVVSDAGDGIRCDHANWAAAGFTGE